LPKWPIRGRRVFKGQVRGVSHQGQEKTLHLKAGYIDADFPSFEAFPLHSHGGPYIRQVWNIRKSSAASDADIAAKRLVQLEAQKERILAQMQDGRVAGDDFSRLYDAVRIDIADTQERLWQAQASELDIDTALAYLNYLLWNVGTIWQERELDGKQRLQKALFPKGLVWSDSEGLLNTSSHSIYTLLSDPLQTESDLVGPEGFEPPAKGL
jgi:hypothetical protein